MPDLLSYKGYQGSIEYSAEDDCLVGEVLFIEGRIVYAGDTVKETRAMFEQAIDDYLEFCEKQGAEPRKPFKGTFNVRVDPELHRLAAIAAKCQGMSLNAFVCEALKEKLSPAKEVHNHSHMHLHEAPVSGTAFESQTSYVASPSKLAFEKEPWANHSHH